MPVVAYRAQQLCEEFWTAFCRLIGHQHLVYPQHNEGGIRFSRHAKNPTLQDISLKEPICLLSWPCKRAGSGRIDIVLDYTMTVQIPHGKITRSEARVIYFPGGIAASPDVEVFRFDYHPETGLPAGDPVFHLQFNDNAPITEQQLPPHLRVRWRYKQPPQPALNTHVRIPTSRMLLPDILCCLVADHLRGQTCNVHKLVAKTQRTVADLTKLVTDTGIAERRFWQYTAATKWYRRGP